MPHLLNAAGHGPKSIVPFSHAPGFCGTVIGMPTPCFHSLHALPVADEHTISPVPERLKSNVSLHFFRFCHDVFHGSGITRRVQRALGNENARIATRLELKLIVDDGHAVKFTQTIFAK